MLEDYKYYVISISMLLLGWLISNINIKTFFDSISKTLLSEFLSEILISFIGIGLWVVIFVFISILEDYSIISRPRSKKDILLVTCIAENSRIPIKNNSIGYLLFSAYDYTILPNSKTIIDTGIIIKFPDEHFGRVIPLDKLDLNKSLKIKTQTFQSFNDQTIKIEVKNYSDDKINIKSGEEFAKFTVGYNYPYIIEKYTK
jgi:dUTPase